MRQASQEVRGTHQVAVSADAHVTTVVACTFLEGSSSAERSTALSSDSRGRLVFHNVTSYLSITNFIAGLALSLSTFQSLLWSLEVFSSGQW